MAHSGCDGHAGTCDGVTSPYNSIVYCQVDNGGGQAHSLPIHTQQYQLAHGTPAAGMSLSVNVIIKFMKVHNTQRHRQTCSGFGHLLRAGLKNHVATRLCFKRQKTLPQLCPGPQQEHTDRLTARVCLAPMPVAVMSGISLPPASVSMAVSVSVFVAVFVAVWTWCPVHATQPRHAQQQPHLLAHQSHVSILS